MGYAEVAEVIVAHWLSRGPNDLLFEPLVFNHRHALELVLKAATRETARRLRAAGRTDPKLDAAELDAWLASPGVGHNLHKLASRLDRLLGELGLERLPRDTHRALMAIHELDPTGETFRYAKVKQSGAFVDAPRPRLDQSDDLQAHVDVAAMHRHFREAFDLVSGGIMTVLEEYAEYQAWMQDEGRP